jgi:hypothetical protein
LYLCASLCLATGLFHPEAPGHDAHHHPDHPAHEHGESEPRPTRDLPDICDFTLQALMTVMWQEQDMPHVTLLQAHPQWDAIPPAPVTPLLVTFSSRAPPTLRFMSVTNT